MRKRKPPTPAEIEWYEARERNQAKAAALAAGAGKLLTDLWTVFGTETTIDTALSLLQQAKAEYDLGTANESPTGATVRAGGKE